jgi:phenylpropionate dioxygenase-like ring-hydroxylating dioxygenase large terminal subunit
MATAPALATARPHENYADLVRDDVVHRRVYTDPELFAVEMDRLFGRAWIYAAHESQFPNPFDYCTVPMGRQSIILTRDEHGEIHGLYNRCTHRGATLCAADRGHARKIVCPYHGWAFNQRGDLETVPLPAEYGSGFRKEDWSVRRAARVESYRGFVFVNLSEDGPSLVDYLGHMRSSIDNLVDRAPQGKLEVVPTVLKHSYRANWKMTFENLNDTLHASVAHSASVVASKRVTEEYGGPQNVNATMRMMLANGKNLSAFQETEMVTERYGHSYIGGHIGQGYTAGSTDAYTQALIDFHGAEKARDVLSVDRHLTLLYPSSTWHARYQCVRIVRPVAVDRTEVWGYVFKLPGAPPEVFANALEYCNGSTSGCSPVITDDLEIYERCLKGNGYGDQEWIPMSRGAGASLPPNGKPNRSPATSEIFIRNQFQAWAHFMGEPA